MKLHTSFRPVIGELHIVQIHGEESKVSLQRYYVIAGHGRTADTYFDATNIDDGIVSHPKSTPSRFETAAPQAMSDYDKLTVVKLRDELVKRGLPKSGLKAVLVNRLIEADAHTGHAQAASQYQDLEDNTQKAEIGEAGSHASTPPQGQTDAEGEGATESDTPQVPVAKEDNTSDPTAGNRIAEPTIELEPIVKVEEKVKETTIDTAQNEEAIPQTPSQGVVDHDPESKSSAEPLLEGAQPLEVHATPMEGADPQTEEQAPTPQVIGKSPPTTDPTQIIAADSTQINTGGSTQSSLTRQELLEDTNKRKRRSQSPPPSSIETAQKRARADDGRPRVKLPEDVEIEKPPFDEVVQSDADMVDAPPAQTSRDIPTNGHTHPNADNKKVDDDHTTEPPSDRRELPRHPATINSPLKPSPSDTRFKNLFTASSRREGSPPHHSIDLADDDRVVTPAIHPATSALYIRDIMRPLHSGNLKDHLTVLATPSGSAPDADIVTDFYLDSIRTHCLVGFTNTSAAARVRSGLHDRVWPDERSRKPLWVDFVPKEKVKKWIEVESEASTKRGQAAKRWEVVYEEEENGLMAYLQEAGANSSAPRPGPSLSSRTEAGKGVQGAPSGPRVRDTEPRISQSGAAPRPGNGKGFQALDDLFKSTAAKPKLYYLPMTRNVVNRRLDMLAAGHGGGRGDETRRYTFEEDVIVDRGPEFGSRGRGGYGGRGGGYGGGYQGRGGGRRGDRRDWR